MQRTHIAHLDKKKPGQEVVIRGWIQSIRKHKTTFFVVVRDKSGAIQVVFPRALKYNKIEHASIESVIEVTGIVQIGTRKRHSKEVHANKARVLSVSNRLPFPIFPPQGIKEPKLNTRLKYRWLDLRSQKGSQLLNVWTELERGFRDYFEKHEYTQIHSPSIIYAPLESDASLFSVDYFGKKAYLAQSQSYKQMAIASGLEKVFSIGPIFRAERSYTTRHLAEFTGLDFEISFIDSPEEIMTEQEKLIISGFRRLKKMVAKDISVPTRPFPRITFHEAKSLLQSYGVPSSSNIGLTPTEEKELSNFFARETSSEFLYITDFPSISRPFYYRKDEDDLNITRSFDLLYRGVEISSGALREHRYKELVKAAESTGVSRRQIAHYLDFFKYGCPPHGGVGMGMARIIQGILRINSIADAVFLPRTTKRLIP